MELASIFNYLQDSIDRNNERLRDLEKYFANNPSKSLNIKKIGGRIYYYRQYRLKGQVKQKYLKKIDLDKEKKELVVYNNNLQKVRERYKELKERNKRLIKVFHFIEKIEHEH